MKGIPKLKLIPEHESFWTLIAFMSAKHNRLKLLCFATIPLHPSKRTHPKRPQHHSTDHFRALQMTHNTHLLPSSTSQTIFYNSPEARWCTFATNRTSSHPSQKRVWYHMARAAHAPAICSTPPPLDGQGGNSRPLPPTRPRLSSARDLVSWFRNNTGDDALWWGSPLDLVQDPAVERRILRRKEE